MTSPAQNRSLVIEREMQHPPEKVWRALTQGHLMEDWLMANDFEPVVGKIFTFRAPPQPQWDGKVSGEVLAVEPQKLLSYGWNVGDDPETGMRTVVTWTLSPTATGGVHLRMEHSGFRPDQERNLQGANYGWQRFLDGLERVVAGLD